MKKCVIILRSSVLSLEAMILLAGFAVLALRPDWLSWLSGAIGRDAEVLRYGGLAPAGLLAYDLNVVKSMLFPESDKRAILQGWSRYWDLKCGGIIGVVYGGVFTLGGIASLLLDWKAAAAHPSWLLLTSVAGAVTTSATLYFGSIKVEELFRAHAKIDRRE